MTNISSGSFRDPSGFIFTEGSDLYRQINKDFEQNWEALHTSGLYDELTEGGQLVRSSRVSRPVLTEDGLEIIQPERIPFISYPYEWCFSQLQDAALLTLEIATVALKKNMVLKDASAYNVQFVGGKPIFIDSLSFEIYEEGKPWVAYKQFCQHFLAPLALMSKVDIRLGRLLQSYIDGVPLDLTSQLLPGTTKIMPGMAAHIHLHSKSVGNKASLETKEVKVSKQAQLALIDSLVGTVKGLHYDPKGTEWGDYYSDTNYSDSSLQAKRELVSSFIASVPGAATCYDLGANTGEFSALAAKQGLYTVAFDIDPAAVEKGYQLNRKVGSKNLLNLMQDLTNPSQNLGWAGAERDSIPERGKADIAMALALVHHLAISNNVPLKLVSSYFHKLGRNLVIEFVPKDDSQVQRLLASRKDIFPSYTVEGFEQAFAELWKIARKEAVPGTVRTLYLLEAK